MPILSKEEAHVWWASLDSPPAPLAHYRALLSADETERAGRFHFAADRDRFIAGRGMLRSVLSRYIGGGAKAVRFAYSAHGKPRLDAPQAESGCRFNVSHSGPLMLIAVIRRREVGVDIERVRPEVAVEKIAEKFFSQRESAALRALPPAEQPAAFFRCWTRKEAYIKARGQGLSIPLDQFDVSLAPGEPAKLLHVGGDPEEARRWWLHDLNIEEGYIAALAAEGNEARLMCRRWLED